MLRSMNMCCLVAVTFDLFLLNEESQQIKIEVKFQPSKPTIVLAFKVSLTPASCCSLLNSCTSLELSPAAFPCRSDEGKSWNNWRARFPFSQARGRFESLQRINFIGSYRFGKQTSGEVVSGRKWNVSTNSCRVHWNWTAGLVKWTCWRWGPAVLRDGSSRLRPFVSLFNIQAVWVWTSGRQTVSLPPQARSWPQVTVEVGLSKNATNKQETHWNTSDDSDTLPSVNMYFLYLLLYISTVELFFCVGPTTCRTHCYS